MEVQRPCTLLRSFSVGADGNESNDSDDDDVMADLQSSIELRAVLAVEFDILKSWEPD